MPEQALYLKWRPSSFDEMVGQEHITRTLRNSLKTGRIRHAYLFSGPRGTGKTTTARLLAKAVNCLNPDPEQRPDNTCSICQAINEGRFLDLIEIDAATHTGVDDVRDLRDKIAFAPGEGQYKVYIIDEVHRFSGSAFDALLKTLEEPPEHAIFVLATTEIDKVPATIKSRCLQFEFRRFSVREVADRLAIIAADDGLKIERGALEMIARQGTGSMRDSISLLDQIVADPTEAITLELVQRILGTAGLGVIRDVVQALSDGDTGEGLRLINIAVDGGADPRQFGQQVVEYLRRVLLAQTSGADLIEASQEDLALYQQQAAQISRSVLMRAIRAFNDAVNNFRGGWQPQLALELALIESIRPGEDDLDLRPAPVAAPRVATPAAASAEPEIEAMPPGTPPLVPLIKLREEWTNTLRAMSRINSKAPDVVANFRIQRIEGNTVYLATDSQVFYDRLQDPLKIKVVEKALYAVHNQRLFVKVIMVSAITPENDSGEHEVTASETPLDDSLLSLGKELGAEIRRRDE